MVMYDGSRLFGKLFVMGCTIHAVTCFTIELFASLSGPRHISNRWRVVWVSFHCTRKRTNKNLLYNFPTVFLTSALIAVTLPFAGSFTSCLGKMFNPKENIARPVQYVLRNHVCTPNKNYLSESWPQILGWEKELVPHVGITRSRSKPFHSHC